MLHSNAHSSQNLPDMSSHSSSMNTSSDSDSVRNRENQNVEANTGNNLNQNMQPPSGENQQSNDRPKRRRYQRHSPEKIKEMEAFFNECPHPDEKQRRELGNVLGLDHLQIKFWFQNKRTQIKTLQERSENVALKAENEELRAENENYKQVLANTVCPCCAGPAPPGMAFDQHQVMLENAHLREQIERMSRLMANIVLQPATSNPNAPSQHNDINMPPSVLNQGLGNVPSPQHNDINMPSSSLNQGLGNVPSSQHNDINMPPSALNQGIGKMPSSRRNDINMPTSVLNQGLGNMPSSQPNGINMPPSLLNQGIGNMALSQHNTINMPPNVLNQGLGNVPLSQHNDINMPSSSLNQRIGNRSSSQYNNINMPSSSLNQRIGNMPSSQHNNINIPSNLLNQVVGSYGAQPSGTVGETSGGGRIGDPLRSLPVPAEYSDKPMIEGLAAASLEELTTLALAGKPMWVNGNHNAEVLNEREYFKAFPRGVGPKLLGFKSESSRESMVINMNHINLIEILMDVDMWSRVFCGIVSRAATLEVLSNGVAGSYDGNLQVVSAEFQVPSPLVPPREYYFLRYCKKLPDESWVVVDVSLETIRPSATVSTTRRRPSGCLIQASPDGYSTKVTWVEHVEVDDRALAVHSIYKLLVDSGLAFGARRWVASLDRQCERIASTLATNIQQGKLSVTNREGRKGLLKLAERMVMSFCSGVGASTAQAWTTLSPAGGHNNIRIMTRKGKDEPGRPSGIVIGAATSFRLPVPPNRFFEWIRSANMRSEWDILSSGGIAEEFARVANGRDPGNCVSLLRVKSSNPKHNNMILLQESCTDSTGSFVIYAPIDVISINSVLGGRDPDRLPILPSGFAILPDGAPIVAVGSGSCLITVAFQILIESDPEKKISICSVSTINQLVKCTVDKIKAVATSNRT